MSKVKAGKCLRTPDRTRFIKACRAVQEANPEMAAFTYYSTAVLYLHTPILPLGAEIRQGVVIEIVLRRVGTGEDFFYKISTGLDPDDWVELAQSELDFAEVKEYLMNSFYNSEECQNG